MREFHCNILALVFLANGPSYNYGVAGWWMVVNDIQPMPTNARNQRVGAPEKLPASAPGYLFADFANFFR